MRPFPFFRMTPILLLVLSILPTTSDGGENFGLKGTERILFFGDSITQNGGYVTDIELFLLTRFPEGRFTVINHGISSETISGTSEPDHNPRRPDAHDRFDRDVAAWNPGVVVACFGMNDGNYHPFDEGRFAAYQAGVKRLIDRVGAKTEARLVFLTPPPFDPYRRQVGDPDAVHYGYRFPAIDYDRTLDRYARWLLDLREVGFVVADVHQSLNDHLTARRRERVSFSLAGDAVHPDPTGHLLMAITLLRAWNAPSVVSEVVVDAAGRSSTSEGVEAIETTGETLSILWTSKLPMPVDPACDRRSLEIEKFDETLNRHRLAIRGLEDGKYRLRTAEAGGPELDLGHFTSAQLAEGLNLLTLEKFPTNVRSKALFDVLAARWADEYNAWRKRIAAPSTPPDVDQPAEADRDDIRARSRPIRMRVHVTREG